MVEDVYNITKYDEDEIVQAVGTQGPVSIAYDVSSDFMVLFFLFPLFLFFCGIAKNTRTKKPNKELPRWDLLIGILRKYNEYGEPCRLSGRLQRSGRWYSLLDCQKLMELGMGHKRVFLHRKGR